MRRTICTQSSEGDRFTWIDVEQPSAQELTNIAVEFGLSLHIVEDCLQPDHLPKREEGETADFLLVRQHLWPLSEEDDTIQEISTKVAIFFNPDLLITVHRRPQPFLQAIYDEHTLKKVNGLETCEVITRILRAIVESYEAPLAAMSREIEELEDNIFLKKKEPASIQEDLYYIKRKASKVHKLLYLTAQVVRKHKTTDRDQHLLNDMLDMLQKLDFESDQVQENAANLLHTYLAMAAHRTNEIVRILTIFSVFFMPLTFIVGIYGMNFDFMPELRHPWGYPLTLIGMLGITLGIFVWFRRNKWV